MITGDCLVTLNQFNENIKLTQVFIGMVVSSLTTYTLWRVSFLWPLPSDSDMIIIIGLYACTGQHSKSQTWIGLIFLFKFLPESARLMRDKQNGQSNQAR